jgi:predicted nucleic acid-binding Zn ribbon protein
MSHRRRAPRPVSGPLDALRGGWQPDSPVARVQTTWSSLGEVWASVVGEYVAARAQPASVTAGVLTVRCSEGVVAEELNLQSEDVLARLNERLGGDPVTRLRCVMGG